MSTTTSDLQLFKYDTSTDGKEVFSISSALNANWDKIDSFASAIKSLSNLSTEGEKRFTDLENSIANKLEADVLLAENGYIKFNNIIFCYGSIPATPINPTVTLPVAYEAIYYIGLGNFGNSTNYSYTCYVKDYTKSTITITNYGQVGAFWMVIGQVNY